jgi:hypothetical protein
VHEGVEAAQAADSVGARAFAVGRHLVFGPGEYAPQRPAGERLLAHELAHALQQGLAEAAGPLAVSGPGRALEQQAQAAAANALHGRPIGPLGPAGPSIAREAKTGEETPAQDKYKGTRVSQVIVSLARRRVGFDTPLGMILGDIDTDPKPGRYELTPEVANRKWIVVGPNVKSGLRFKVMLDGAYPWTLSYPEKLPLIVAAGSAVEPKTWGDMLDPTSNEFKDPLSLFEGLPLKEPVAGIDDFESVRYDLDYRSVGGNLSKVLAVDYPDNTHRDINLDDVKQDTPRLWAAKQEALKVMDEYNALFILGTFPTVFFILTIQPMATPVEGAGPRRYSVSRRSFSKPGPKQEGAPKQQRAVPKEEPTPVPKSEAPAKKPGPKQERRSRSRRCRRRSRRQCRSRRRRRRSRSSMPMPRLRRGPMARTSSTERTSPIPRRSWASPNRWSSRMRTGRR